MSKLCQIIAIVTGKKTRAEKDYGELNKVLQKGDLFAGMSRTYRSFKEGKEAEEEKLPAEHKYPQRSVRDVLSEVHKLLTGVMNAVVTQEVGNLSAKADVIVDGKTIIQAAPVTALLYIEKQLNDLNTFVGNIPTLDPAYQWKWNKDQDRYETQAESFIKTKKLQRGLVLYEATEKHPAQCQLITEDVNTGEWTQIKYSTAMNIPDKRAILERINKLQDAVKFAREQANSIDVNDVSVAEHILKYVFSN